MSIDLRPITGTAQMEPDVQVDLDPRAEVRFIDTADEFGFALCDGGVEVMVTLPRTADAWLLARGLARRIEGLEPEVRTATIGYQHGPHTGPGRSR